MSGLARIGTDSVMAREMFLISLGLLGDWPQSLRLPSKNFVLFVTAEKTSEGALNEFALKTLEQGACYVSSWGTEATRIETFFDRASIARGAVDDDDIVMTTAHVDETLEEALYFATTLSCPSEAYKDTCDSLVAAVIGNDALAARVHQLLQDSRSPS